MKEIIELILQIILKLLELLTKRKQKKDSTLVHMETCQVFETARQLMKDRRDIEDMSEKEMMALKERIRDLEDQVLISKIEKERHVCNHKDCILSRHPELYQYVVQRQKHLKTTRPHRHVIRVKTLHSDDYLQKQKYTVYTPIGINTYYSSKKKKR